MRWLKRLFKEEDGAVVVIVALALVVLLGCMALVVDAGVMYVNKAHLQNVADAAALAGAQALPDKNEAEEKAIAYGSFNGVDINPDDVNENYADGQIEVICRRIDVPYFFARVWGFDKAEVTARAVAKKDSSLPSAFTDYAIFSESGDIPLYVGKAGQSICNGVIHTNNTLHLGKHLNVTRVEACSGITETGSNTIGSRDAASPYIPIPTDFKDELLAQVTAAPKKYIGDQTFGGNGLDLSESIYVQGNVKITGNNITGKGFIYATGDIEISGNNTQIGSADIPVFIYSEKNITIEKNNVNMYCIIYAPNGIIDVQKNNWNLHGRLIGKSFADACLKNNFTITAGSGDFSGVPLGYGRTTVLIE